MLDEITLTTPQRGRCYRFACRVCGHTEDYPEPTARTNAANQHLCRGRIRITARARAFLQTHADPGLLAKIDQAPVRRDGSVFIVVGRREAKQLHSLAFKMGTEAAAQMSGSRAPTGYNCGADRSAADALIRQLARVPF